MPRIVYVLLSDGRIAGGQKMILRHVETLRDLGFNAVCYLGAKSTPPTWLDYDAPLELATPLRGDDIVVVPDDARPGLTTCLESDLRTVVFSQNPYSFAARTFDVLAQFPPERTMAPEDVAEVIAGCVAGRLRHTRGEVIYLRKTL